jgi:hypothetical protein
MGQQPRVHHYVAKLYQRGFARRTGRRSWQARVLDRRTGADEIRNIDKVFALPHWNSVTDAEGNRDAAVEVTLAEHIDGPAAPGIQAMREGTLPDGADRFPIAIFMAAQLSRGTVVRENLAKSITEVHRMAMKVAVANYSDEQWIERIGEVPSPELKDQLMHSEEHFDIQPTNATLLSALLSGVDQIAEILLKRKWALIALDEPGFFTGEHPVVHVNAERHDLGYGVATADQLHFPVSPSHSLVMSHPWEDWPEGVAVGSRELAERLNWATFTHGANGLLLAHPDISDHPLPSAGLLLRKGFSPWADRPEYPR